MPEDIEDIVFGASINDIVSRS